MYVPTVPGRRRGSEGSRRARRRRRVGGIARRAFWVV